MKIAELTVRNFKKIKLAALQLQDWNEIVGDNEAGKSSLADAVIAVLKWSGISGATVQPVTKGERNGEVTVTLVGDMTYKVKRIFLASGKTTLEVTAGDNVTPEPSPQTLLDVMTGGSIIDPGRFVNLKERQQVEELLEACGLSGELRKLDQQRKTAYDERTAVGRDRDKAKKAIEVMGVVSATGDRIDASVVSKQLTEAVMQQNDYENQMQLCDSLKERVEKLQRELEILQQSLTTNQQKLESMPFPDTSELECQLDQATAVNRQADRFDEYQRLNKEWQTASITSEQFTKQIEDADAAKAALLEGADLGIPGLSFDDDKVMLNGIPLSQCSRSEALRVGVEVAVKQLPVNGVRFIAIKEFAFSQNTKDALRKRFADSGIQFLIEDDTTETSTDGALVIDVVDGMVTERSGGDR